MKAEAEQAIREAITNWKNVRRFTHENKQVYVYKSPITEGEVVLRFSNAINSFFCDKKKIEIALTSRPFHTSSLSEKPLSDNPKGDRYRLEKLLESFDNDFYTEVDTKLNDCIETLSTSDPLFF